MAKPKDTRPNVDNRQARHQYQLEDRFEAGIMLTGSEVKSIREGRVNLQDAYCYFKGTELFIKKLHITPYSHGGYANHEAERERKLLLNRVELNKLQRKVREKGYTIVPVRLFFNDRNLAKLEVALAKGKKEYDKRETLKTRDVQRSLQRRDD